MTGDILTGKGADDLLRAHFETRFQPLETRPAAVEEDEDSSPAEDEEAEWDGVSDGDADTVEIVDHTQPIKLDSNGMSAQERRAFMTSKAPKETKSGMRPARPASDLEEEATDAANLKKDLALQRLLNESHLLENHSSLTPSGLNRHKAMDLQMQTLGSKGSIFKQQRMPMSHRQGINLKAAEREDKRRREAKENGIVLERPQREREKKKGTTHRVRGVGGPAIGKFQGGMLKLSKQDVADLQGSAKSGSGKGKGKGKKRR